MDNSEALALIEEWPKVVAAVHAAERRMREGHYHRPLTEAYEAAIAQKEALAAKLESL